MTVAIRAPAAWALRRHARSAAVIVLATAAGLAAALPALALAARLHPVPISTAGWGIAWSRLAYGPAATQALAVHSLAQVLRAAALAALAVTALTLLALSIARAAVRRPEIVVRRAVGASRRALAAAASIEGAALAGGALAVGTLTAAMLTRIWARTWPGLLVDAPGADAGVAGAAVAGVVMAGAFLPLLYARRRTPGAHSAGAAVPLVVPALQFGLGLTALVAAAQIARRVDLGPEAAATPAGGVVLSLTNADRVVAGDAARVATLLARLRAESAATLVSLTSPGALRGLGTVDVATTDCGHCATGGVFSQFKPVQATHHLVSSDSFRALGLRMIAGRGITDADGWTAARVAVVSERMAAVSFESGHAVGRKIQVGAAAVWYTVVGIVADRDAPALGAGYQPVETVYLSALQHAASRYDLLVRGAAAVGEHAGELAATVLGPDAVTEIDAEPPARAVDMRVASWFVRALRLVGWTALAVAALGMVTVMRLWVVAVLPELALRRAVGARRRHVVGRVLGQAVLVAGGGVAIAWWLGPIVSDFLGRAFTRLPGWSVALVRWPAVVLLLASLAGALWPAWRAARVAPAAVPGTTG